MYKIVLRTFVVVLSLTVMITQGNSSLTEYDRENNEIISMQNVVVVKKETETYKSKSLVSNTKKGQMITDDLEYDMQLILDRISFKFISDRGYYYSRSIEDGVEDKKSKRLLLEAREYIQSGEFYKAKEVLSKVVDTNQYVIEIKINYIVAIMMSEGNYEDALRIVLKKSEIEEEEGRFRFDLVYLLRYLYLNNDFEKAAKVVDKLKLEYPDSDISYAWFGISIKQFDDLYSKGYREPVKKASDSYVFYKYLIENYPDDKFIDHIYYLIADYDKVISDYDNSSIIDKAYYAKAYELYHKIKHNMHKTVTKTYYSTYSEKHYTYDIFTLDENYKFSTNELSLLKEYFLDYFNRFTDSWFASYGLEKLLSLYDRYYKETGDLSYKFELIDDLEKVTNCEEKNKINLLNQIARSIKYTFEYHDSFVEYDERLIKNLSLIEDYEEALDIVKLGLANNAFNHNELNASFAYYKEINFDYFYDWSRKRYDLLNEIMPLINEPSKEALLTIIDALKEANETPLAIEFYDQLTDYDFSDDELAGLYMQKAFCYRHTKKFEDMYLTHEYIYDNYSESIFADDALAEMGVYYLLYRHDNARARKLFNKVIIEYPETNAVNNAYNWIAWSYLRDKDYQNALDAYKRLQLKFPLNRYGINAKRNIKKIEGEYLKD